MPQTTDADNPERPSKSVRSMRCGRTSEVDNQDRGIHYVGVTSPRSTRPGCEYWAASSVALVWRRLTTFLVSHEAAGRGASYAACAATGFPASCPPQARCS